MVMDNLPEKQREILKYIRARHEDTGVFPSVREIAAHMKFRSTNTVDYHLRRLEQVGALERGGRLARSFILRRDEGGDCDKGIPVVGRVAAGQPVFAEQDFSGLVNFRGYFHCDAGTFALRVQGESMIEAGIFDGDLVIVHNGAPVQNGEIAVAMIGDEATVKRIYDEGDRWRLQPENRTMQPIYVAKEEKQFNLAGKVIGVIRKL